MRPKEYLSDSVCPFLLVEVLLTKSRISAKHGTPKAAMRDVGACRISTCLFPPALCSSEHRRSKGAACRKLPDLKSSQNALRPDCGRGNRTERSIGGAGCIQCYRSSCLFHRGGSHCECPVPCAVCRLKMIKTKHRRDCRNKKRDFCRAALVVVEHVPFCSCVGHPALWQLPGSPPSLKGKNA